jgi:predicted nucleotidyltransferase
MKPMPRRIPLSDTALQAFCATHGIRRLALFGSELAGRARPDSDIDLLVEFEDGREPGFLALASMELELADLLGGRKVDLRTPKDLSRYFRDDVVRQAEVQFAR